MCQQPTKCHYYLNVSTQHNHRDFFWLFVCLHAAQMYHIEFDNASLSLFYKAVKPQLITLRCACSPCRENFVYYVVALFPPKNSGFFSLDFTTICYHSQVVFLTWSFLFYYTRRALSIKIAHCSWPLLPSPSYIFLFVCPCRIDMKMFIFDVDIRQEKTL